MKKATHRRADRTPKRLAFDPKAAERLLDEAIKRPGMRELMDAYREAKSRADDLSVFRSALASQTIEWASDSASA